MGFHAFFSSKRVHTVSHAWAAITRYHRYHSWPSHQPCEERQCFGCLKHQKGISHSSGSWEVQDQGAGRFGFWGGHFSKLTDSCPLTVHSHGFPWHGCMRTERPLSSSSCKGTNPIRVGHHGMTSLKLIFLLKAPAPNTVTLGIRASTQEFCGDSPYQSKKPVSQKG